MELGLDLSNNVGTDYDIPYSVTDGSLNVKIPTLEEWLSDKVEPLRINVFTDGSKTSSGTGSGFHCEELNIEGSYRLRDDCSIFQADLTMRPLYRSDIGFFIDSQAAISALYADSIRSKVVSRCHKELKVLSEQHNVILCWVPGHKDIPGNEKADKLAKNGASLPIEEADLYIYPPLTLLYEGIRQDFKKKWVCKWNASAKSVHTKLIWNEKLVKYSRTLLDMDRSQLRMVVNLITGHNTLGKHMVRIGKSNDDTCRWCGEEEESSFHFLCECPALSVRRFNTFGSYYFQNIHDIHGTNPWVLLAYIKLSKWNP